MNATEKAAFITSLIANAQEGILERVKHMPDDWDGHELRAYIADYFADCQMTVGTKRPEYRKATKAYKNAKATTFGL
jgi:hypothetical protein